MKGARTPRSIDLGPAVLGTMTFGGQVDEREARAMVEVCREAGIKMFDSANMYGEGRSEEILGRAVASFRDEVLIASKVGNRHDLPKTGQLAPRAIRQEIELSLRRLGTDRIDLYYLHRPDWATPLEDSLAVFQELIDEGKILAIGQSNHAAWQVMEMIHIAEREGWTRVTHGQPLYNLLTRGIEDEYVAFAERHEISNIVYSPLAAGLLTGKHASAQQPADGTRFALRSNYMDRYWTRRHFTAVEHLSAIAADAGMSLIELSLRWLDAQPHVAAVALGASKLEYLKTNLRALQGPAPDEATRRRVDEVWDGLKSIAPPYNR